MEKIIIETTSIATFAIAMFGIVFCLMQTKYSRVSRSFAAFLAAIALNNMPDAFRQVVDALPSAIAQFAELVIWSPSSLMLAPLFWVYVFTLTSRTQRLPSRLYRHLLLPALAVVVGLIIVMSGQDVWGPLFADASIPVPTSGWPLALVTAVILLQLAAFPQIAFYLFLIIRRLMRHRLLLRDVYASTEEHELRWIYVIGGLSVFFWLVHTLLLLTAFDPAQTGTMPVFFFIAAVSGLVLVAATILWGLRQRPPLVPDTEDVQMPDLPNVAPAEQKGEKYEKSALTAEASTRLAGKLRAAMETDHMHRDPNLSLWALARHIGASPNYISQTLNEVIGESFFDFVNGYRIAEAKTLLSTTNDSVLTITYDVGFNARSSFYNAFKRVTGQTPSHYRKTMSFPIGMDDKKVQSRTS